MSDSTLKEKENKVSVLYDVDLIQKLQNEMVDIWQNNATLLEELKNLFPDLDCDTLTNEMAHRRRYLLIINNVVFLMDLIDVFVDEFKKIIRNDDIRSTHQKEIISLQREIMLECMMFTNQRMCLTNSADAYLHIIKNQTEQETPSEFMKPLRDEYISYSKYAGPQLEYYDHIDAKAHVLLTAFEKPIATFLNEISLCEYIMSDILKSKLSQVSGKTNNESDVADITKHSELQPPCKKTLH